MKRHLAFLGVTIVLLISCTPSVQTTAPPRTQRPEDDLAPILTVQSEWSWKTIRGEVRTYEQTRKVLEAIIKEYGILGLSLALTQGTNYAQQPKTYIFDLGLGKTAFKAGRLGQPVLAYLVMKLVTDEQFDIDKPLQKYLPKPLPEYPAYSDLKEDSRYKRLTARLILSHQSGLANSRLTHPEHKLTFETSPGDRFGYSEEGYRLLQFVLEQKFGRSLNDLAKSNVFDPLGMSQTSFIQEPRFEERLAPAASVGLDSKNSVSDVPGTFITSASDYTNFIWLTRMYSIHLSHEAFFSYVITPQVSVRSSSIFEPPRTGDRPTLPKRLSWCLGWGIYEIPRTWGLCFIGQRHQGTECFAMAFESLRSTALSIFVTGNVQRSVSARIIREILGEIETPLTWLGFEDAGSRSWRVS
jgi:D-alanyl-D-alanine-carboxypeptidase/D-alanyl-D-alanine-endopeptidase